MKELFPGNYTLVEYYDPSVFHFRVRLQFDDPRDKVIFLLKHSSWQTKDTIMAPWERFLQKYNSMPYLFDHYGQGYTEEKMKEKFPGNYHLVEYYYPKEGKFKVRLEFDDPMDEVIFHLKYSSWTNSTWQPTDPAVQYQYTNKER